VRLGPSGHYRIAQDELEAWMASRPAAGETFYGDGRVIRRPACGEVIGIR